MDNTAGVLRSNADSMISSSFRMNLPSALLLGAKTRISGQDSIIDISSGRIGRLGTGQIEGFDTSDGKLFSLGYNRDLGRQWRIGTYALDLEDAADVPDHQSIASAVEYQSPDDQQRYKAHLLFDSKGQNGAWLDGDTRVNRWRNRYGVFRLEPDLLWADTALTNDQQGAYIRSETRSLRNAFTTGLDFVDTNLDNTSTRPDNYLYNGFLDDSWRVTYKTTIGSTLTVPAAAHAIIPQMTKTATMSCQVISPGVFPSEPPACRFPPPVLNKGMTRGMATASYGTRTGTCGRICHCPARFLVRMKPGSIIRKAAVSPPCSCVMKSAPA